MDPAVLFFDEPTSALDPIMSREVIGVINRLYLDNVTMLCVTHDLLLGKFIADRVLFLDDGMVRAEGSAEELFSNRSDPRLNAFFAQEHQGQ
jgi:polar amino acid transport system ATP-binding protein